MLTFSLALFLSSSLISQTGPDRDAPVRIPKLLHAWLHELEEELDRWWNALGRALGRGRPKSVIPFTGWDNTHHAPEGKGAEAVFGCRVLATPLGGGPREKDRWWHNLVNTYRRWDTQEVPGAVVSAQLGSASLTVTADEEGYAWFRFAPPPPPPEAPPEADAGAAVRTAHLFVADSAADRDVKPAEEAAVRGALVEAELPVIRPGPAAPFGVISDMDDTVIHTGITNLFTAAKLTFLRNARTRKPLPGVSSLYRALEGEGDARAPFFYVSSSAWNLHDLLTDFLELNQLPVGPLLLQDLGLDRFKFMKPPGHTHKLDKARRLVDAFPGLPFVLFGDSGQADPHLYATLVKERPGRVAAILIRDIDAGQRSERDKLALAHLADAADAGTPAFLVHDSVRAAEHLIDLGLLDPAALPGIREDTAAESGKPGLARAAATGS